jgi:hypothetical protein
MPHLLKYGKKNGNDIAVDLREPAGLSSLVREGAGVGR